MNQEQEDALQDAGWSPTRMQTRPPLVLPKSLPPPRAKARIEARDGDTLPSMGTEGHDFSETLPEQAASGQSLCVAVDDVGLHAGINGAAVELAMAGRAQALACRVTAPAWTQVVPQLPRLRGLQVEIGLQLDLTEHLSDASNRRALGQWLLGAGVPKRAALEREIDEQLTRFESATGYAPDFICGHRHVHQTRSVRSTLVRHIAQRYQAGHHPWLRAARPARGAAARPSGLRDWALARSAQHLHQVAREESLRTNRQQLGLHHFDGGAQQYHQLMTEWLPLARDGDVLVCHPSQKTLAAADRWLPARAAQHQFLMSRELPALLERLGLQLQPMRQMLARRSRW